MNKKSKSIIICLIGVFLIPIQIRTVKAEWPVHYNPTDVIFWGDYYGDVTGDEEELEEQDYELVTIVAEAKLIGYAYKVRIEFDCIYDATYVWLDLYYVEGQVDVRIFYEGGSYDSYNNLEEGSHYLETDQKIVDYVRLYDWAVGYKPRCYVDACWVWYE